MRAWVHKDPVTGECDICVEFVDAIGPDFAEVELDESFVKSFSQCQLEWAQYQSYMERLWEQGEKQ